MQQEDYNTNKKNNSNYIQPFYNFIQGYNLSNIYKMIAPDFLYQVFKGFTSKYLMY